MADNKGKSKKPRKHKVSAGIHGATKHPLDAVSKVLLGKGLYHRAGLSQPSKEGNWRGEERVIRPWNPVQAEENRRLYPHLFTH